MTVNTNVSDSSENNPFSALGDALDAAAQSVGDARADATASAKVAAAKVQSGVSTGAYYAAYGLSYGLVFSGVFIKELLPAGNPVRRGFEDGATAAFDAATHTTPAEFLDEEGEVEAPSRPAPAPVVDTRRPD